MPSYAYFRKKFVPLAEANINIMTHSLHYGTAIFEGIRGNWNEDEQQMYIFRLKEHYQRLKNGSRLLKMDLPSVEEMSNITVEMVRMCGFKEDIYIRPLAYKSSEMLGVRLHNLESDFTVFAIPWGAYLDTDGCKVCVSSWRRPADNVIPPQLKVTGIYINNAFTKTEAQENGFDEGIMLTPDGYVAEGSGENIFLVKNGQLITPPVYNSILVGITRDTVIRLARNELGLETAERPVVRSELYNADECLLTGTAAHITPVCQVDRRPVGSGGTGPVTARLQKLYFDIIQGKNPKYKDWCTPAY